MNVFRFRDYKLYLKEVIQGSPSEGRGLRQKFATAAGCQLPYVSHVLNGDYHFNSEQIDGIANLLKLSGAEHEFLLLLVQWQRAGTASLKKFYKKNIDELSSKHNSIKEKIQPKQSIPELDRARYYSDWSYAAVHVLTTIPEFRTISQIANRLNLSVSKVEEIVRFLISARLLKQVDGKLLTPVMDLHLESESVHIQQHHTNWRVKAIQSLSDPQEQDLHYSLSFSIHPEDLIKVKEVLLLALKDCAKIIRPSEEKELAVLNIDLFNL